MISKMMRIRTLDLGGVPQRLPRQVPEPGRVERACLSAGLRTRALRLRRVHDLVFCDPLGGSIHPQRLTECAVPATGAAGVLTGTLHILRHTHATLALTNGVPLHVGAARIGDRPETLLTAYAHLLPHSDVEAANQVAALIGGQHSG
jgi:integrase